MRILIISATQFECQFIEKKFQNFELVRGIKRFKNNECTIDLLIAGIGIPSTIYNLLKTIKSNNYDFVLNTGIAGAFKKLNKGDVVHVISDEFADIGFENKDGFITVFEQEFHNKDHFPFKNGHLISNIRTNSSTINILVPVHGITVNKTSFDKKYNNFLLNKYKPDIETMEGAAVFYVCLNEKIPCCQIRSISNFVGESDKNKWNIPLALKNLEDTILKILDEICEL